MIFEDRIQKFDYRLNDTDEQIVEYILKNKEEVKKISIQVLAKNVYTVPNTIIRLSKKLGYDGFSHLKANLREELELEGKDENNIYEYVKKTFELMDEQKLNEISKLFHKSRQIFCYGIGDTVPFGESMVRRFKNMRAPMSFYHHRHEIIEDILGASPKKDLLVLISVSGESQQILEVAKLAKEKKIHIISLTHFNKSSLGSLADTNLFFYSPERRIGIHDMEAKTPLMLSIELLGEHYLNYINNIGV